MARRKQGALNLVERDVAVRKLMMRKVSVNQVRNLTAKWARDLTDDSVAYHGAELVVARMAFQEWLDWQLRQEDKRITSEIRRLQRMTLVSMVETTDEGAA